MVALAALLIAASPALAQRIDRDVQAVLQRTGTPGATLLVLRDGRLLYEKAYGLRSLDSRLPARLDTHYELGSITKQFNAAAILQLQAAGKLRLDATVATYIRRSPRRRKHASRSFNQEATALRSSPRAWIRR